MVGDTASVVGRVSRAEVWLDEFRNVAVAEAQLAAVGLIWLADGDGVEFVVKNGSTLDWYE
jgi:hypothetical protein